MIRLIKLSITNETQLYSDNFVGVRSNKYYNNTFVYIVFRAVYVYCIQLSWSSCASVS